MGNYSQDYRQNEQDKVSALSPKEKGDDIDIERLVWDQEYREQVKALLQPKNNSPATFGPEALH